MQHYEQKERNKNCDRMQNKYPVVVTNLDLHLYPASILLLQTEDNKFTKFIPYLKTWYIIFTHSKYCTQQKPHYCKYLPFSIFQLWKGRSLYISPVGRLVGRSVSPLIFLLQIAWLSPILTKYHHLPSITTLYWPSVTMFQLGPSSTGPVPPSTNYFSKYCLSIKTPMRDLHCLLGLVLLLNHRYIYIGTVCILLVQVFIPITIMVSIIVRAIWN